MNANSGVGWLICIAWCLAGCTPPAKSAQYRSPSHDYPPPPLTTADGEVIGADRRPVTDAIRNSRPPADEERKEKK
jgi:hypothetical protein